MDTPENWPGTILDKCMLMEAIGKFLRTHKGGGKILTDWLESVPPDRTEEEYKQLKEAAAREHEAGIDAACADYNKRRALQGLPPIDWRQIVEEERKGK
jgi:hypothetical protein